VVVQSQAARVVRALQARHGVPRRVAGVQETAHPRSATAVVLIVLATLAAVAAVVSIRGVILSVLLAVIITVGLDPILRTLQRHRFSRAWALATVICGVVITFLAILLVVTPIALAQKDALSTWLPGRIDRVTATADFDDLNGSTNGVIGAFLEWIALAGADPTSSAALATGVVGFGLTIEGAIAAGIFVAILVCFLVVSWEGGRLAAYRLVRLSRRADVVRRGERIILGVGRFFTGTVTVALINAVVSGVLLAVVGVPAAVLIAVVVFFITLVPVAGTIVTTIGMTVLAYLHSPTSALIVLVTMLVYMQVEAYLVDPFIMRTAVEIPIAALLIAAVVGGVLLGLVGILIAIPLATAIILIIREVVWPAKERT